MNILLLTNTYRPHVGGVAKSVEAFAREYRARGHGAMVVAPKFDGKADDEQHVIRVEAVQKFNGSDFSLPIPIGNSVDLAFDDFKEDVVHAHHPFLLGDTAIR